MGYRRMFSLKIVDSAKFLKMPTSSQLLYFHLGMRADDDGVVEGFNVLRMTGLNEDDLKILVAKGYVQVLNEDLVSFITDWREHNLIRADRKTDSIYKDLLLKVLPQVELIEPRKRADLKKNKENGRPQGNQLTDKCQPKLSKDKLSKDNIYSDLVKNYPGKKIKSVRDKKLPKILEEYSVEEIKRCIKRYSEECKGKEKQFILNESTFWNGRYIDYLDKNYQEENKNIEDVNIGQVIEIEDLLEGRV